MADPFIAHLASLAGVDITRHGLAHALPEVLTNEAVADFIRKHSEENRFIDPLLVRAGYVLARALDTTIQRGLDG